MQRFYGFEFLKLVAGPWGELSQDFHLLLRSLAEKRVESSARAEGRFSSGCELGKVMGDIRRALSVEIVRGQALCLLDRLSPLGPGARKAGERRQILRNLENKRRQQAQAYYLAYTNRGLSRIGRAFVP